MEKTLGDTFPPRTRGTVYRNGQWAYVEVDCPYCDRFHQHETPLLAYSNATGFVEGLRMAPCCGKSYYVIVDSYTDAF